MFPTTSAVRCTAIDSDEPPLDGSVPAVWGVLDWRAEHTPDDPWMIYPSSEHQDDPVTLTFSDCATASHRASYGFRNVPQPGQDQTVTAVLLNTDTVHYTLLLMGMMRAGFIVSDLQSSLLRFKVTLNACSHCPYL